MIVHLLSSLLSSRQVPVLCRPTLGNRAIADIKEPQVRRWRKQLLDSGVSTVSAAKAYRLLKAIMTTVVDDGLIRRNPCRIKGAAQDRSPERSALTLRQVRALTDVIDPRYRTLVLLAAFASLRWGELAALRRADIGMGAGTVTVAQSLNELPAVAIASARRKPRPVAASLPSPLRSSRTAPVTWNTVYSTPGHDANYRRRTDPALSGPVSRLCS
jgi:integrase